ncbi:hypothetical protein [Hydrogenimonas sp. SS33]|uniref:hypothetical protein n=1 Tax=Hydrogenimonas leucolamina TaxID=2954236 RepID=UPI00336C2720
MKTFLLIPLLAATLWAIDYSDRSTQELIAALAHAKAQNAAVILRELKKREITMTPKEREAYMKALKKLQHAGK